MGKMVAYQSPSAHVRFDSSVSGFVEIITPPRGRALADESSPGFHRGMGDSHVFVGNLSWRVADFYAKING